LGNLINLEWVPNIVDESLRRGFELQGVGMKTTKVFKDAGTKELEAPLTLGKSSQIGISRRAVFEFGEVLPNPAYPILSLPEPSV
jgi:hypothetical protein